MYYDDEGNITGEHSGTGRGFQKFKFPVVMESGMQEKTIEGLGENFLKEKHSTLNFLEETYLKIQERTNYNDLFQVDREIHIINRSEKIHIIGFISEVKTLSAGEVAGESLFIKVEGLFKGEFVFRDTAVVDHKKEGRSNDILNMADNTYIKLGYINK